jgi:hypothetical protein
MCRPDSSSMACIETTASVNDGCYFTPIKDCSRYVHEILILRLLPWQVRLLRLKGMATLNKAQG